MNGACSWVCSNALHWGYSVGGEGAEGTLRLQWESAGGHSWGGMMQGYSKGTDGVQPMGRKEGEGNGGSCSEIQKVADLTALWGGLHAGQLSLSVSNDAVHCSVQPCNGRVVL